MHARLPILVAAAFAAGAALSACASTDRLAGSSAAPPSKAKSCFYRSQVNGFQPARTRERGSEGVIVSVGPGQKYLFETLGPCPDIRWTEAIGFDQFGPGQICDGLDVTLVVPSTIGPRRCPVKMIRQLSPEEARAY